MYDFSIVSIDDMKTKKKLKSALFKNTFFYGKSLKAASGTWFLLLYVLPKIETNGVRTWSKNKFKKLTSRNFIILFFFVFANMGSVTFVDQKIKLVLP